MFEDMSSLKSIWSLLGPRVFQISLSVNWGMLTVPLDLLICLNLRLMETSPARCLVQSVLLGVWYCKMVGPTSASTWSRFIHLKWCWMSSINRSFVAFVWFAYVFLFLAFVWMIASYIIVVWTRAVCDGHHWFTIRLPIACLNRCTAFIDTGCWCKTFILSFIWADTRTIQNMHQLERKG